MKKFKKKILILLLIISNIALISCNEKSENKDNMTIRDELETKDNSDNEEKEDIENIKEEEMTEGPIDYIDLFEMVKKLGFKRTFMSDRELVYDEGKGTMCKLTFNEDGYLVINLLEEEKDLIRETKTYNEVIEKVLKLCLPTGYKTVLELIEQCKNGETINEVNELDGKEVTVFNYDNFGVSIDYDLDGSGK